MANLWLQKKTMRQNMDIWCIFRKSNHDQPTILKGFEPNGLNWTRWTDEKVENLVQCVIEIEMKTNYC